ncbi:hypothetical protein [Azospirillum picis]|uniref:Uncharacterized protein n=1 Tax=Azospirillum picis TaxID=488438 RepID=A0ABU0MPT4_9PROT|nr:hypothetical protein [Azospirillum picis]MBP2301693.1 hypothetical protein [Azospirillum picis]MDQ0535483.1 hypothetical protein [Azospirillum picis]
MFPDHGHRRIAVASAGDIAAARRIAAERADGLLGADEAARLDGLVAALGARLCGRPGGTLLIGRMSHGTGIDCLAYDRDPATPDRPVPDLDEVAAWADRVHTHVTPGIGMALLARVMRSGSTEQPPAGAVAQAGGVMVARDERGGEETFIDHWFVRCDPQTGPEPPCGLAVVIDGDTATTQEAGQHGRTAGGERKAACRVTPAVVRQIERVAAATVPGLPAPMVVNAIRRDLAGRAGFGLAPDRELVGRGRSAVAVLRFDAGSVDYTALGTVAGAVVRRQEIISLSARWNMVGFNPLAPASVHLLWGPGDHVVLHTGCCARLPALFLRRDLHGVEPTLAALVLLRDGVVCDDDHAVLVLRNLSPAPAADA